MTGISCDVSVPTEAPDASGKDDADAADDPAAASAPSTESRISESRESAAATGSVEGAVRYTFDAERPWRYGRYYVDGRKGGPLAEAVICLESSSHRRTARRSQPTTVVVDQKDHAFVPETVAVRVRDRIRFTNSDYTLHNVNSLSPLLPFNVNVSSGSEQVVECTKAGGIDRPILVGCHLHSSMRAWIFVFDHPYFQVTARDGRFRMKDVPAGRYDIVLRHPAGRLRWRQQLNIEKDRTHQVEIAISPDQFEEF